MTVAVTDYAAQRQLIEFNQKLDKLLQTFSSLSAEVAALNQFLQGSQNHTLDLLEQIVQLLQGPPSQVAGDPTSIEIRKQPLPPA